MSVFPILRLAVGVAISLLLARAATSAQQPANPDELKKFCETVLCRKPGVVRLTLDNGKAFETRFDLPRPIVQNEWISVFPGETIYVEAEASGNRLVNLRAVEAIEHPEKTLTFQFSQKPGPPSMMMLVVTNPFKQTMKYHASMMLPTSDKLAKTSSCPVGGGGRMAFESWPSAIIQLVLFDFRLLGEGTQQTACEF